MVKCGNVQLSALNNSATGADVRPFKSKVVIVNFHGSVVLPYCIKAKRCMSITLWVTGGVWPYV